MTNTKKNKILNHLYSLKSYGFNYLNPIEIDDNNNNELPNNINELNSIISNCNLCQKAKNRKNILYGEGNINPKILILFSNPLVLNDDTNNIIVGKSGEMVTNIIKKVLKVDFEDVYFSNIIKCYMGNNNITKHEINCCKPYLDKQITLLNPKVILAFGVECYNYIFNENVEYSKVSGQNILYKNINMVTTHSVTMMIRNPSLKKEVMKDLERVNLVLEKN